MNLDTTDLEMNITVLNCLIEQSNMTISVLHNQNKICQEKICELQEQIDKIEQEKKKHE